MKKLLACLLVALLALPMSALAENAFFSMPLGSSGLSLTPPDDFSSLSFDYNYSDERFAITISPVSSSYSTYANVSEFFTKERQTLEEYKDHLGNIIFDSDGPGEQAESFIALIQQHMSEELEGQVLFAYEIFGQVELFGQILPYYADYSWSAYAGNSYDLTQSISFGAPDASMYISITGRRTAWLDPEYGFDDIAPWLTSAQESESIPDFFLNEIQQYISMFLTEN